MPRAAIPEEPSDSSVPGLKPMAQPAKGDYWMSEVSQRVGRMVFGSSAREAEHQVNSEAGNEQESLESPEAERDPLTSVFFSEPSAWAELGLESHERSDTVPAAAPPPQQHDTANEGSTSAAGQTEERSKEPEAAGRSDRLSC
jgi:hypothetical protein